MDRLTGKESSSLMEAYSSIYNKDNEEINEGLLDRTALQPLKQAAKTELKRLGSQALNKYLPMAYGATLKGGKDLGKAGIEAAKTNHWFHHCIICRIYFFINDIRGRVYS